MPSSQNVEIEEARRIVLGAVAPLAPCDVELDDALGRVLAEDLVADRPLPAFDVSAMDGFAVKAGDLVGASSDRPVALSIVGESRAGSPATASIEGGQALAISTGGVIPAGADAVVPVERTSRHDGRVEMDHAVAVGADVRRAGEDVAAGATVLSSGTTLGPAQLGMLASLQRSHVSCARQPRVSVLVTGDELLAAGEQPRPGAIGDSNSHSLAALARCAGAQLAHRLHVGDDAASTRTAIAQAASDADALIICGGVSVGEHDHVRPSLAALGARQEFWGLALRPGHPTWFGTLHDTPVFGLPGNPVSAMVTFVLFAAPALRAMQGAPVAGARPTAVLDGGYQKPAGRAHALRCRLSAREDGWHASVTSAQGSHVLSSMLAADALAIVPSDVTRLQPGARVEIEPLCRWTGPWR